MRWIGYVASEDLAYIGAWYTLNRSVISQLLVTVGENGCLAANEYHYTVR